MRSEGYLVGLCVSLLTTILALQAIYTRRLTHNAFPEEEIERSLSTHRKRRGIARASITRLTTRLRDLETKVDQPATIDHAKGMLQKLDGLGAEFLSHHHGIVDLTEDEDALRREQETLNEQDDLLAELSVRITRLIGRCTAVDATPRKITARKLSHIKKAISHISSAIAALIGDPDDKYLLLQFEEQFIDLKKELSDIRRDLLSSELEESDELVVLPATLESDMFNSSIKIKKLISSSTPTSAVPTTSPSESKGVRLPKLEVPTFDGDILNWRSFWEQFSVSVHSRPSLSDSEKLVYLQQSLKDGSAKNVIEGLSRSGDNYTEAIGCLKARYDRPRLIHQIHVRMILEAPSLRDGSGKELRRLHDSVQQHLRALKAMGYEPSAPFITSALELKMDTSTMFEWQRHSQDSVDVPDYSTLLEFLNLRAQASENSASSCRSNPRSGHHNDKRVYQHTKPIASFVTNTIDSSPHCVLCKTNKHPLYACTKFKSLPHDKMLSTLKENSLCLNCLRPGHFVRECQSAHRCRKCQKPHHTLLHVEPKESPSPVNPVNSVTSNVATGVSSNPLLMTCWVLIQAPDGSTMKVRALLDSASSASFISERLTQVLRFPRTTQRMQISGVAGLSHGVPVQSITQFTVAPVTSPHDRSSVSAIVVPRVTCDLPVSPVTFKSSWKHLTDIPLADPEFGCPGRIDLLLGVDIFVSSLLHGRRTGPPGSPTAFETKFGWVLAGSIEAGNPCPNRITTHHACTSLLTGDDLLRKFWEIEESPRDQANLSQEERAVVQHFETNHRRTQSGRFVVPLAKNPHAPPLGESRAQAVRRFHSLERSLHSKNEFSAFNDVMQEYFDMCHAEPVPLTDLEKSEKDVFYLPMHAVKKESSSTTKIRAVFDASSKSTSGVSLNDLLLVGPTVHSSLVDVLLRFRLHRIALTTDVSKMYRAVELVKPDRDLHRFVWRSNPDQPVRDFRMTRVTFGVSASSFAANMSVKQNSQDFALEFPQAASAVETSFYVDDGLTGADSVEEAIQLQKQLQELFSRGGFLLRKWNSNEAVVLQGISSELRDNQSLHSIPDPEEYTKTLGIQWNSHLDHFRLSVTKFPETECFTKRLLVSDIAKTFDVLGWFSPSIVKIKILLQRIWELKTGWDDPIPPTIKGVWLQWKTELALLSEKHIPRCYYPKRARLELVELHGFSDASEEAYAAVIYLRMIDAEQQVHTSLITSKTKVAPIKRLTIPRLELCGAHLLAQLLHHVKQVFRLPLDQVYAWTDSTIVLGWLDGSPRRFKTYVGNRISRIIELIPSDRWNHVAGIHNPADCASRGLFPSEFLEHELWWNGPTWLSSPSSTWPQQPSMFPADPSDEEKQICHHVVMEQNTAVFDVSHHSSYTRLKRITAWIFRFIANSRDRKFRECAPTHLTTEELIKAETYWLSLSQRDNFPMEISSLKNGSAVQESSPLFALHPFLDSNQVIRVGGRLQTADMSYSSRHPVLHGKHPITHLIISSEHLRLLHGGPMLIMSSLCRRYHIVGGRRTVRSITRKCIICRRTTASPQNQVLGQLPLERITPGAVFDKVGIDYAGPFYVKYGSIRKPTVVKAYVCLFVSLSVKAVHIESVSDMTTDAFIAALRRFMARRGKPSLIWSDHGTNFVGATREMKTFFDFLEQQKTQGTLSHFCSSQNISWKFIPERAPNFGGLWEAAVKSMKMHLKRVISDVKLTFEEFTTIITQVEACLNSRPLIPMSCDDDGIEALTPGHFLIGKPLEALPDPAFSYRSVSLLRRWHLCQSLVRHFWKRWSTEYLSTLRRYTKWHRQTRNLQVGDIVLLQESNLVPTRWPLGKVVEVCPGGDGFVRVVKVKTQSGIYKRPISKVAVLIPSED